MLSEYLDRIGLTLPLSPNAENLRRLQLAHLYHVPFEDLDIHTGRPIRLGLEDLYRKIVVGRRGGFCYELNGLFAWLLSELGYRVSCLSASDYGPDGKPSRPFDHLALLVYAPADAEPGAPWLVDVGYGDTFRQPLRLNRTQEQSDGMRLYRFTQEGNFYQLWEQRPGQAWERHYFFDLLPHTFSAEYEDMCRYHQTSLESPFPRWRVCTLATPSGRITLDNSRLILTKDGQREEKTFGPEEFPGLLKEYFGIIL
jgi:N-hydroxyarylamine O-acetyltransferase